MSMLASVTAALGPDVDLGAPDAAMASAEMRRACTGEGANHGPTLLWDADPIVAALQESTVYAALTGVPGPSQSHGTRAVAPAAEGPAPMWSPNGFVDELLSHSAHGEHAGGGGACPPAKDGGSVSAKRTASSSSGDEDAFTLSCLSPKAVAACRLHLRDLSTLRAILQRPPAAFHLIGAYDVLMTRLATNGAALVGGLVRDMERLWAGVTASPRAAGERLQLLLQLLCLYAEVLFYLSLHAHPQPAPLHADTNHAGGSSNTDAGGFDAFADTDAEAGAAHGPGFVTESLAKDPAVRRRVLELVVDLSGDVRAARGPSTLQPRRCSVLLACLCLRSLTAFEPADFLAASARAGDADTVLDLCLVGALAHRLRATAATATAAPPPDDGLTAVVVARMCRTTIYSLDLVTLFREEGRAAALLRDLATLSVGASLGAALDRLSPTLWQYFTKAALLSMARALSVYAWCWPRTPLSVVGLLTFVDTGLTGAVQAWEAAQHARRAPVPGVDYAAGLDSNARDGARLSSPPLRRLLAGALGHDRGGGDYDGTTEEGTLTRPATSLAPGEAAAGPVAVGETTGELPDGPDTFRFATPAEQFLYFLSVHAYVSAAMTFTWVAFADGAGGFLWTLPRSAADTATSEAACPRDEEAASWTSILPTLAVLVGQREGVRGPGAPSPRPPQLNLLHQTLTYVAALARSVELPRVHAAVPPGGPVFPPPQLSPPSPCPDLLAAVCYDAGVTLLFHLLTSFPQELGHIREVAHCDVLDVFEAVALATLRGGPALAHAAPARLVYDLLRRFHAALTSVKVVASLLLPRSLLARVGGGGGGEPAAVAAAFDQLLLSLRLYEGAESETVLPSRLFLSVVHLEPGALTGSHEGLAFFAYYLQQVMVLLTADVPDVSVGRLGAARAMDGLTIVKAIGNTCTLVPSLSAEQATVLLSRLSEGVLALARALDRGTVVLTGAPVARLLTIAAELLAEVTRLTGSEALAGSLLLPAAPGLNGGHPVPAAYVHLALLFQMDEVPESALLPLAQLVCASVHGEDGVSLAVALRTHLLRSLRNALATAVHHRLRSAPSSASGITIRLKVLHTLSARDPAAAQLLVGPESVASNRSAREPADLLIAQVLAQIALGAGSSGSSSVGGRTNPVTSVSSSYAARAAALQCLTALQLTEALPLPRILAALSEATKAAMSGPTVVSALDFVAAASAFANAAIVAQAVSRQEEWAIASHGGRREAPSPGPMPTPLSLGAAGSSAPSEATDAVLRRGSECLIAAADLFGRLSTGEHLYFPDTSALLVHELAGGGEDTSAGGGIELGGLGLSVGATALVDPSASLASLTSTGVGHRLGGTRGGEALGRLVSRSLGQRSGLSIYHTERLPDAVAEVSARQEYLFPLVLGPSFRLRPLTRADSDEVVTAAVNTLASIAVGMTRVAAAMEAALWLSCRDGERSALFLKRSCTVLHAALRFTLMARPTAPALAPTLWTSVQRGLALAGAAAHVLRAASGGAVAREGSVTGGMAGGTGVGAELDVGDESRRGLRHLTAFLSANKSQLPLVNGCLGVFTVLGNTTLELGAHEDVFAVALAVVQDLRGVPTSPTDALVDELAFMRGLTMLFERLGTQACPIHVLAYLLPAVFKRATALAAGIAANGAEDTLTSYFCECLRVLRGATLHATDAAMAVSFLPAADILRLAEALGHFASSAAVDEGSGSVPRRQCWHAAWCAVLELLVAVLASAGGNSAAARAAGEAVWLPKTSATVRRLPRFLLALAGFTDVPASDRVLHPWDLTEAALCTELAALLAARGQPLPDLLPAVQRGFLSAHRFGVLRYGVATMAGVTGEPERAARELRGLESVLVRVVRDQLSFLLVLPAYGVRLAAPLGESEERAVVGLLAGGAVDAKGVEEAFTFDVLRRFVNQQLQAMRRAGLEGVSGRPSEALSAASAPLMPSRETSVPPTPSMARAAEASTVAATDDDYAPLAEALRAGEAAENRATLLEVAQLALCLFTAAAEEVAQREQQLVGRTMPRGALRELRGNCEKLLLVLDAVRRDIGKVGSPKTTAMVTVMRGRLRAVVASL